MGFVLGMLIPLSVLLCGEGKGMRCALGVPSSSSHLSYTPAISPNMTEMGKAD